MNYIPTGNNYVVEPGIRGCAPNWAPFTDGVFQECMGQDVPKETLGRLFPGPTFFGRFVGSSPVDEMEMALGILRATRNGHAMLEGGGGLIEGSDCEAAELAESIEQSLSVEKCVKLTRGGGYTDELNPENAIPQCHIYHCEIRTPEKYAKWLRPRVDAYHDAACMFQAEQTYYLLMSNNTRLSADAEGNVLLVDIYGGMSLTSDWDEWLNSYEARLPADITLSGLELVAGLLHLFDTLATVHLITAIPVVSHGAFIRPTAGDSLTDFWLKCYDIAADSDYVIGTCEVCHQLFIGESKNKRGHAACLNRQRVKRARARKFAERVESGMPPNLAARKSSISISTAIKMLTEMGYTFNPTVDYAG